jgi:hypothetical protein
VADITVQVTSPGLTAYGNNSWGSLSYGGDNINIISTGSVDAYNSIGWGRLSWGSLVWGQDFISVTVAVTTPGTPTTWGQSSFGNYSWGQVTATQSELGDETIYNEQNAVASLSTNLLNISTASLAGELQGTTWNYQTWGSNAWAQTAAYIFGDSNLSLNTNLLNTTIGFTSENVNANTIVQVTSPGNLPWGAESWGSGSWGDIGGMDISQGGEEVVVPSVEVNVIGNQLNTTIGTYSITANANVNATTNILNISLGDEDAIPNTQVTLSTNLLTLSQGFASGETLSTISVTGVQVSSQLGRVFISAWAVVDIGVTNAWTVVDIAA